VLLISSAQAIMDDIVAEDERGVNESERGYWKEQFVELENRFFTRLQRERSLTVAESTLRLLSQSLDVFNAELSNLWQDYNQRRAKLDNIRIRDLQAFANEQHSQCTVSMASIRQKGIGDVQILLGRSRNKVFDALRQGIYGSKNKAELRLFLEKQANSIITNNQNQFQREFETALRAIERQTNPIHASFDDRFNKEYAKLQVIKSQRNANLGNVSQVKINASTVLGGAQRESKDQASSEALRSSGGLVGGAIVGQMLIPIPVVGAVVGAVIGNVISAVFGPSLDKLKSDAWTRIQIELSSSFNQLETKVIEITTRLGQQLEDGVHDRINMHVQRYGTVVQGMLNEYEHEKQLLETKQTSLKNDMQEVERRHGQVEAQRVQLMSIKA
jgi:hypothetical protein